MTTSLTVEQRKRIAEACIPDDPWEILGNYARSPHKSYWAPESHAWQWQALTRKCASLIFDQTMAEKSGSDRQPYLWICCARLIEYLKNNNTDAIEQLVYELITGEKA